MAVPEASSCRYRFSQITIAASSCIGTNGSYTTTAAGTDDAYTSISFSTTFYDAFSALATAACIGTDGSDGTDVNGERTGQCLGQGAFECVE